MSMRSISAGATRPQRGPPTVLLLAISAVSGTPSAKIRLRALELVPHTRVRHRRLGVAVVALPEEHARQVLHRVLGVDEVDRLLGAALGDADGDGQGELLDRLDRRAVLDLGGDVDGAEGLDAVPARLKLCACSVSRDERRGHR